MPSAGFLRTLCQKTQLCRFYEAGSCTRGRKCRYAHGKAELRVQPDLSCTKLCPNYETCHDEECPFAHTPEEVRRLEKPKGRRQEPAVPAVPARAVPPPPAPPAPAAALSLLAEEPAAPAAPALTLPVPKRRMSWADASEADEDEDDCKDDALSTTSQSTCEDTQSFFVSEAPSSENEDFGSITESLVLREKNTFLDFRDAEEEEEYMRPTVSAGGRLEGNETEAELAVRAAARRHSEPAAAAVMASLAARAACRRRSEPFAALQSA